MLIHELTLRGILSFGPETPPLTMRPLNLLIGPNGSGKSNLLEAIGLVRNAPWGLTNALRSPGSSSVGEWMWKGNPAGEAMIEAVLGNTIGEPALRHTIRFTEIASRFELLDESIEADGPARGVSSFHYGFRSGHPILKSKDGELVELNREHLAPNESILSQVKDPERYPELTRLTEAYSGIRQYREWAFGRSSVFRVPQRADLRTNPLGEDFSNLGLYLNHLRRSPSAKKVVLKHLADLYEGLDDFDVRVQGGTVEVFLTEGDYIIPASRLSDGTLRYLCLLAILCDPHPPALICLEEPELGLHPDLLPKIADLLIEASSRAQLIVTTHSDILVDAMTERPEDVVVMTKENGRTVSRRLEKDSELKEFLESYRLGEMWLRGMIGGTRW